MRFEDFAGRGRDTNLCVWQKRYGIVFKGLTFDNLLTKRGVQIYNEYVTKFGTEGLANNAVDFSVNGGTKSSATKKKETVEEE